MSYTQSNPQYSSYFGTVTSSTNWMPGVAKLARGYAMEVELIDALNVGGSVPIASKDGTVQIAFRPHQEITQTVASVTQAGANLIVTWNDPTYTGFIPKTIVRDANNYQAYVESTSTGAVVLKPGPQGALVAATHFTAGMSVTQLSSAAGNHYSTGLLNQYQEDKYRTNYSAIRRGSFTVSTREKFYTQVMTGEGGLQKIYAWTQGEQDMLMNFINNDVYDMIYSEPGTAIGNEGVYNRFEGFKAATRNQGGRYVEMTSLFTIADLYSDIDFLLSKNPGQYQNFMWCGGRAAWSRINALLGANNIIFTVSKAVVNGNELNFDVPKATINGATIQFMTWGIFDNRQKFPMLSTVAGAGFRESNTYFMLNLDPLPAQEGGTVPAIRKFHFAQSPVTGGAETLYRMIPGIQGFQGVSTGGPMVGGYQFTASDIAGASVQIFKDGGYDVQADGCVYRCLVA